MSGSGGGLAGASKARCAVCRTSEPALNILYVLPPASGQDEASVKKRVEELIVKALEAADAKVFIRKGCVEDEILACLTEEAVEVLILGHRHKAKRERIHLGSTVRTVISLAPAAVLVFALNGAAKTL